MVLMFIISFLITVIAFLIAVVLYAYLYNQRKVHKHVYKRVDSTKGDLQPIKLQNLDLEDYAGNSVRLFNDSDTSDLRVIVFINEHCIHCDNNLESLIDKLNKLKIQVEIIGIIDEGGRKYGSRLLSKYDGEFKLLYGNQVTLSNIKIKYYPAFLIVNKERYILTDTPNPLNVISVLQNYKKSNILQTSNF